MNFHRLSKLSQNLNGVYKCYVTRILDPGPTNDYPIDSTSVRLRREEKEWCRLDANHPRIVQACFSSFEIWRTFRRS